MNFNDTFGRDRKVECKSDKDEFNQDSKVKNDKKKIKLERCREQ